MQLFNTKIELVEPTKILERVPVDSMRFLNPIGHDYIAGAYKIEPSIQIDKPSGDTTSYSFAQYSSGGTSPNETNIRNEVYNNIITINKPANIYALSWWQFLSSNSSWSSLKAKIKVIAPDNTIVYNGSSNSNTGTIIDTFTPTMSGNYKIQYIADISVDTIVATYSIYALANVISRKSYSITDVINRILNAGLGTLNGYYKLDPVIAEKWDNIQAPEFEITGKTLYEALLIVGGYKDIQAIPRLGPTPGSPEDWEFNFITFDSLNGAETWIPPVSSINYHYEQDAESYCAGFDSYVDNFVDQSKGGVVGLDFPQTVRTESSDIIIDDNFAIIKTSQPIYRVEKLEQAYINNNGVKVGDITPYVFEKSEYDNLTKYKGEFPTAKQFAFYYIQGQPNLYGLCEKPETATAIGLVSQDMAAVQIAERKSGQKYVSANGIASFAYTIKYTPMQTRRLRQYKPYDNFGKNNILFYNQSANIVDSRNFGSRMKAELARIGNPVEYETYRLNKLSQIPKVGMLKDGKYISQVDWEIGIDYIKVTIYLVKNYNRLSEYIGINSMQRYYEVSEKQATNRICNFSYFVKIGDKIENGEFAPVSTAIDGFADTFRDLGDNSVKTQNRITFVKVQPKTKDSTDIGSETIHEVSSNGFGNSMSFYFKFENNYSAGVQALYEASARKIQRAVPYGDEYGEFYKIQLYYYPKSTQRTSGAGGEFKYSDQVSTSSDISFCDNLPQVKSGTFLTSKRYFNYEPVIDKNSGEAISIETQFHFQANRESIVIGTALGSQNTWVSGQGNKPIYVCLPYRISSLQETIAVNDVTTYKVSEPSVNVGLFDEHIEIGGVTNTTGQKALSMAIVDEQGNILLAENQDIEANSTSNTININFNFTK